MDEQRNGQDRPVNPRRRKRSKFQTFKEAYLPVIIAGIAVVVIIILIIGSIVRAFQHKEIAAEAAYQESLAAQEEKERLEAELDTILSEAARFAANFDYDKAISTLNSFSGSWTEFPIIEERLTEYTGAKEALVLWDDPQSILSLSTQLLVVDPERAFSDPIYGNSYKRHYITTDEFQKMLEELYANDYILIRTEDCYDAETDSNGQICFINKPLYLPAGKKPLILIQTNVCYNLYMVDSNSDNIADKDGAGFAHKLVLDENNNVSAAIFNEDGFEETGAYDFVPILEAFVQTHPDFSYKGARAILALTGFDGILGYRTDLDARDYLIPTDYAEETAAAQKVFEALKTSGYEFACYTYRNVAYGDMELSQIRDDLSQWKAEVEPLIGPLDMFVFAQQSDIAADTSAYNSDKHTVMKDEGFNKFVGFCTDGKPWQNVATEQIRFGRILVTASNLANSPEWFEGILDPQYVLTANRE